MKHLRKAIEALKTVNTLASVTPAPEYAQLATEYAKQNLQNWRVRDTRHQKALYPEDEPVFVQKPPKQFNLAEVAQLVRLDAQKSNVKFRFVAEDASLHKHTIAPVLRRLTNNGVYYTVFENSAESTTRILNQKPSAEAKQIQTTLVESHRQGHAVDEATFQELPNSPPPTLVEIQIDNTRCLLATPSLPLIVKMRGIGVPLNHPDHAKLQGQTVPHPLLVDKFITFHSIPEKDDKTLVALIPSHVLEHRSHFSTLEPIDPPGPIVFEGKAYTLSQLTDILAERLKAPVPLLITAPYIVNRHFLGDTSVTKVVNGQEVLDPSSFDSISMTSNLIKARSLRHVQHITKHRYFPLDSINSGEVYDLLKFTGQSRLFHKVGLVTADMLRSVILESDIISAEMLEEKKEVLEVLMGCLQYFKESEFHEKRVKWIDHLKSVSGEQEDKVLINAFYDVSEHNEKIGEFANVLMKYIVLLETKRADSTGLSEERKEQVKILLSNVLLRILQDPIRRLFPELSSYWLGVLQLTSMSVHDLPKGVTHNKWNNHITYEIESGVEVDQSNVRLMDVLSEMHAFVKFPAPFSVSFELPSDIQSKELLSTVIASLQIDSLSFTNENQDTDTRVYADPVIDEDDFKMTPYRTVPDFTSLDETTIEWCKLFETLKLGNPDDPLKRQVKAVLRMKMKYQDNFQSEIATNNCYVFINKVFSKNDNKTIMALMEKYREHKDGNKEPLLAGESLNELQPGDVEKKINEFM